MRKMGKLSCAAFLAAVVGSAFLTASAQAAKPEIDCSKIRGVCYFAGSAEQAERELGYGKRVGLNATRFWCDQNSYHRDKEKYVQRIVDFVRVCDKNGYKCMPILFNGNMLNPKTIEPDAYAAADEYAKAMVEALKDEPGLLMFDAMNEPLCCDYINKAPKEEKEARKAKI